LLKGRGGKRRKEKGVLPAPKCKEGAKRTAYFPVTGKKKKKGKPPETHRFSIVGKKGGKGDPRTFPEGDGDRATIPTSSKVDLRKKRI